MTITPLPQAPVIIAKSVTATRTLSPELEVEHTRNIIARPCEPTAAVKCPRKQFRPRKVERAEPPPHPKKKSLSALQEIREWQTRVNPLLPLTPFTALVREFIKEWGNFRITRDAVLALRCGTEQYLVDTLQILKCFHVPIELFCLLLFTCTNLDTLSLQHRDKAHNHKKQSVFSRIVKLIVILL